MTFDLKGVAYGYEPAGPLVLDQVSARLPSGCTVALLGRSGSGKTTLLSLLGLLGEDDGRLRAGSICYTDRTGGEHRYADLAPHRRSALRCRHFGYVPQQCYFLSSFSVEQNILMPLALQGRRDGRDRLAALLKEADVGDLQKALPSSPADISGGQRQRLAILRAVIHNPDVVFGDEPISNLDDWNKERMLTLLQRWQQGKLHPGDAPHARTLLLVCHDLETAWQVADWFLFLIPSTVGPGSVGCRLLARADLPGGLDDIRRFLRPATDPLV